MFRKLLVFLLIMGFVFSMLPPVEMDVDSCQQLDAPGEYTLVSDLTGINDTGSWCLYASGDNIVLDCNGHTLSDGRGTGIHFKGNNLTIKNCIISGYEYGMQGDSPSNTKILNNTIYKSTYNNVLLGNAGQFDYSEFSGNTIYGTPDKWNGATIYGFHTTVSGNKFYNHGNTGLEITGDYNTIEDNTAYNNDGSGVYISGFYNNVTGNTAYGNDWAQYQGAGFEFGRSAGNLIGGNTAYNNTNGFYVQGIIPEPAAARAPSVYGNTITENHAYDNLVGLNLIDYNSTVTGNTFEENIEADLLIGGDSWIGGGIRSVDLRASSESDLEIVCVNTITGNTGSGGRPIYYSYTPVNLNGGTYSEILLCNATGSTLTNVVVSGSNTLDNNGVLIIFSDGTTVTSTTSKDNFMGFGVLRSENATIINSDASGSGLGVISVGSHNLVLDRVIAANNKMDSEVLLELIGIIFGGSIVPPVVGVDGQETLRAPIPEMPENGISAILFNTDYAQVKDSQFSGSTAGLLFINSHHGLVSGGSAYNNIIFGYGMVDCYAMTFENARAYGNKGTLQDITGDTRLPPELEMLAYIPLGMGIIDLSISLLPATSAEGSMRGSTEPPIFDGNYYSNVRSYNNNYGMVFLAEGNEWVDESWIYDNSVLGILDAANPGGATVGYTMPPAPSPTPQLITVSDSRIYRNGEGIFATLEDIFEENDRPTWASAFRMLDTQVPKGVFELELVEASPFMGGSVSLPVAGTVVGYPWTLDHATLGAGPSAVELSITDEAEAVYVLGDTTLPSLSSIHLKDSELEIDTEVYFDFDSPPGKKSFNNKNFMIVAVGPGGRIMTPSIGEVWVHYGSPVGYTEETMGLYYLDIHTIGEYCAADGECSARGDKCVENMCVTPECSEDADCTEVDYPYCVGYQCSQCRDSTDCEKDCAACVDGTCQSAQCTADVDCGEGCRCERNACVSEAIRNTGETCGVIPLGEETLRAEEVAGTRIIMKGTWVPVDGQVLDQDTDTIYATSLSQRDRTSYLSDLLNISLGDDIRIYLDVYGLFAVYKGVPGGGGGDTPEYVCSRDIDCPECYYCSYGDDMCKPKSDVECGVPGTGCPQGYECEACECVKIAEPPDEGCASDRECADNQYCADGTCTIVPCECGEVKGHKCISYECCSDNDCEGDQVCRDHKCSQSETCDECDDTISEADEAIERAKESGKDTSEAEELLAKAKQAKEEGDCETALSYAEAALAAALASESAPTHPPIISTEVPSIDKPKVPNGEAVTQMQREVLPWVFLAIVLLVLGFWYWRNRM